MISALLIPAPLHECERGAGRCHLFRGIPLNSREIVGAIGSYGDRPPHNPVDWGRNCNTFNQGFLIVLIELLAVLAASASGGMRIALPLLLIGLLQGASLWSRVPLLSALSPNLVIGVLVSWSLFELFASKRFLGQRILQLVQLLFSPLAGAVLGMALVQATNLPNGLTVMMGIMGGALALVLQLVQVGWFFRLRGLPLWAIFVQDALCIFLVLFAFDAPTQGGVIALMLLWLAVRSSTSWYQWRHGKPQRDRQKSRLNQLNKSSYLYPGLESNSGM